MTSAKGTEPKAVSADTYTLPPLRLSTPGTLDTMAARPLPCSQAAPSYPCNGATTMAAARLCQTP
jgi:hypothetical protein